MKVKVCINTHEIMFDRAASIELDLPYVPRVDDVMYLSNEQSEILRQKLSKKLLIPIIIFLTGNVWVFLSIIKKGKKIKLI